MRLNRLWFVFLFLVVISGCKESKNENIKYPEDFSEVCVKYFNKWNAYLGKMKDSKRFDEETIAAFKSHRNRVLSILISNRDIEREKSYCSLEERSFTFFKPIDNMNNMTQTELEAAMKVESIKQLHKEQRRKP